MAREEEKNRTVQEVLVHNRSCREVTDKGCKETGLSVSTAWSWKAPVEIYKLFRAAIAASAVSTPGVQQSGGGKGQNCIRVRETCMSDTGWEGGMDTCRGSSQTISIFPLKNATLSKLWEGERK